MRNGRTISAASTRSSTARVCMVAGLLVVVTAGAIATSEYLMPNRPCGRIRSTAVMVR